ncbi:MAG: ABC transporter permease [Desulfobulbus propionicus]|nr:MAG: ABC transporter permease [Desulfobulbus propionicus]
MKTLFRVATKEFATFFSSPVAFLFFAVFLAVTLFVFFWVETFFSRNIADIRPLFEWMPVLLIFLTSAITMRMWAEEHRSGTLELLLAAPVSPLSLVAGKFIACLGLVVVSLLLTLPLPLTVSFLGPIDWGPVLGGYVATLFLAAAYIAIGLFVSVKSENQIISLIMTTLICSLFFLVGSDTLRAFFGNQGAEVLQLIGSGSRFDSITRGVIDVRDLYYYFSIMGVFLTLNIYGLERIRWAGNKPNSRHKGWKVAIVLVAANFLVANFWLAPCNTWRVDMTSGQIYSVSDTTRAYLHQIKEPLLIRGYFSSQTHPLLAPLVPRLRDLLEEYAIAGGSRVQVEFVDPLSNPEVEQEAGRKYGIRPVPFQTTSKYQASVTNSYFDILVQYGDQFETLGFRDLIEIKSMNEQQFEVELRNPEYDITRAIKKVVYSYQSGGNLLDTLDKRLTFTGYFSPDTQLPKELVKLKQDVLATLEELNKESTQLLAIELIDPDADGGKVAGEIQEEFGFQPMVASLFAQTPFWFYMMLSDGEQTVEVPLPEGFEKESLRRSVDGALKRFAKGFAKTIALYTPPVTPPMMQYGMPGKGMQFSFLKQVLSQEHIIKETDLKTGYVPPEADLLIVMAPENLEEKQVFAIDQFLMQGGTVIMAVSPFTINLQQHLSASAHSSGVEDWLAHFGISLDKTMVLDPQNSAFPVPVQRNVGGFSIQETRLVNYPYFVDIRPDGMNEESGLLSGLNQVTMNWASPLIIDEERNEVRRVIKLLNSSAKSWHSSSTNIQPDFKTYGELGFKREEEQGASLLAAVVQGNFSSFFAGKPSPLLKKEEKKEDDGHPKPPEANEDEPRKEQVIARQLDKSPDSARLVLFGSESFVCDTVLNIGSSVMRTSYLSPAQMIANTVDWSLEDSALLSLRGRSHFSRTLLPMSRQGQLFWEYFNYGLALLGLVCIWFLSRMMKRRAAQRYSIVLQENEGDKNATD